MVFSPVHCCRLGLTAINDETADTEEGRVRSPALERLAQPENRVRSRWWQCGAVVVNIYAGIQSISGWEVEALKVGTI